MHSRDRTMHRPARVPAGGARPAFFGPAFRGGFLLLALAAGAGAQPAPTLDGILARLEKVEADKRALENEIASLREEVQRLRDAGRPLRIEERLDIHDRRIEEHAQTKVETLHKYPVRLSGMALANVFRNTSHANNLDTPLSAAAEPGRSTGGLSFRQSVIGLEYHGGATLLGGQVHGSVFMDFFDGLAQTSFGPMRMRTATVELEWKTRTLSFAQEKPLIAPRDPTTLSYGGVSPLTASGNLWRWQPQIRLEQRVALGGATMFRAQGALYQTSEDAGYDGPTTAAYLERRRPGLQGRFELSHRWNVERRAEVAGSFHTSQSHVAGFSLPSRLASVDWLLSPARFFEFSGTFFSGKNIHHFGALRQGLTLLPDGTLRVVESKGGWGQLAFPVTDRLSFHIFGGIHDDRNRDLAPGGIGDNRTGAVNLMYRLAPNVMLGLEAMQIRTDRLNHGVTRINRYDLSVAYLF
jgi:hypothetical protein